MELSATTQIPSQAPSGLKMAMDVLLPFALIFLVFYFLVMRPQQKRIQAQKELLSGIKKGDTVVTSSGMIGQITEIPNDQEVKIQIDEGVNVKFLRHAVSEVRKTPTKSPVLKAAGKSKR